MENFNTILLLIGLFLILIAYLRFITDESGNIHLNNYRLTGGIFIVLSGLMQGTIDIFKFNNSKNRFLSLLMYLGIILVYLSIM